jgi:hypothetical protein
LLDYAVEAESAIACDVGRVGADLVSASPVAGGNLVLVYHRGETGEAESVAIAAKQGEREAVEREYLGSPRHVGVWAGVAAWVPVRSSAPMCILDAFEGVHPGCSREADEQNAPVGELVEVAASLLYSEVSLAGTRLPLDEHVLGRIR